MKNEMEDTNLIYRIKPRIHQSLLFLLMAVS